MSVTKKGWGKSSNCFWKEKSPNCSAVLVVSLSLSFAKKAENASAFLNILMTCRKKNKFFPKGQISAKLFLYTRIFHICAQVNLYKGIVFGKKRFHRYFLAMNPQLLLNNYDETITLNQMNITSPPQMCAAKQGCQSGFFEARFWNSGFFWTSLAFFGNQKSQTKSGFFWLVFSWKGLALEKHCLSRIFIKNLFWKESITVQHAQILKRFYCCPKNGRFYW